MFYCHEILGSYKNIITNKPTFLWKKKKALKLSFNTVRDISVNYGKGSFFSRSLSLALGLAPVQMSE